MAHQNDELVLVQVSETPSAATVADWKLAAAYDADRRACIDSAPAFDWSEFSL